MFPASTASVRQTSRQIVMLLVLLGTVFSLWSCSRTDRKHYNVLFIVIDTLRQDKLGCYGNESIRTPVIDALAAESLLFEKTYAQSSWTKTSVASFLTGLYPYRHQVFLEFGDNSALPEDAVTLAEILQGAGYQTTGISGNPNVSGTFGFAQGFDTFRTDHQWLDNTTLAVADNAIAAMDSLDTDSPFFLYVHFLDPHDPYDRAPGYEEYFSRKPVYNEFVKEGQAIFLSGERDVQEGELPQAHDLRPSELNHLVALYKSEISQVDQAVGRILAQLEAKGQMDNTIIVVTSDHGEEFLEHEFLRHGYHLFEETIRVPLIVKAPPELKLVGRYDKPVELFDITPTILDFLGIKADTLDFDAHVLPRRGADNPGKGEVAAFGMTRFRHQDLTYLIIGDKKLIYKAKTGDHLLFDLAEDPGENAGQPAGQTPVGRTMIRTIEQMIAAQVKMSLEGTTGEEIDPKLREQLESLGYTH